MTATLLSRLQNAWQAFRVSDSDSFTMPLGRAAERKALPQLWGQHRSEVPQWHLESYQDYVTEGFERNALMYSTIMYKARAMMDAPLRAYFGDMDAPEQADKEHPLNQLAMRPNPYQSRREFQMLLYAFFNIAGNAYLYFDRPRTGALPSAMYALDPSRVYIIPDGTRAIKGYIFVPEGGSVKRDAVPMLPSDVMHVKLPNPRDPMQGLGYGLSPVAAVARVADVDNAVTNLLKLIFEKGGLFMGALKYKIPLTPTEMKKIKHRWQEMYGSYEDWAGVAVLSDEGEYQRIMPNLDELGFEVIDARSDTRIPMVWGVPPILVGAKFGLERATYSNYGQARSACWEDTLRPESNMFSDEFAYFLTGSDGSFVMHDLSRVPALRQDINAQTTAAQRLFSMGYSKERAAAAVGLTVPEVEAEEPLAPEPQEEPPPEEAEAEATEEPTGEEEANDSATEDRRSGGNPANVKLFSDALPSDFKYRNGLTVYGMVAKLQDTAEDWLPRFQDEAEQQFEREKREILAAVEEFKQASLGRKASIAWDAVQVVIDEILELSEEKWRDAFAPLIEGLVTEVGNEWAVALGISFNVRNIRAEKWFLDYMLQFSKPINDTTKAGIHEVISATLADGSSIQTTMNRIENLFRQWMKGDLTDKEFEWLAERLPPYRLEMIARTETTRAENAGSWQLGKDWNREKKGWLVTMDGRERQTHLEAGLKYSETGTIGLIAFDQPFIVGGYNMMYPGDASRGAPPGEFVNCRCNILIF